MCNSLYLLNKNLSRIKQGSTITFGEVLMNLPGGHELKQGKRKYIIKVKHLESNICFEWDLSISTLHMQDHNTLDNLIKILKLGESY